MKAIIFDFDGVLINSNTDWWESLKNVLLKHGISLTNEHYKKYTGAGEEDVINELFPGKFSPEQVNEIKNAVVGDVKRKLRRIKLLPGVMSSIMFAIENKMDKYIVTSTGKELVETVLNNHHLMHYFKGIITADDVEFLKPHPEAYQKAIEKFGLDKSQTIVVEDSPTGVKSAVTAGLRTIVFNIDNIDSSKYDSQEFVYNHQELQKKLSSIVNS